MKSKQFIKNKKNSKSSIKPWFVFICQRNLFLFLRIRITYGQIDLLFMKYGSVIYYKVEKAVASTIA